MMKIETAEQRGLNLDLLPWLCLETQEESAIYIMAMQNRPRPCNGVTSLNLEDMLIALVLTRLENSIRCYALLDGRK